MLTPIYIVSKGRSDIQLTADALDLMGREYFVVVEEFEADLYRARFGDKVLILPKRYQCEYPVLDDLGMTKSVGPGAARNFALDHSKSIGAEWHWVMDDNIDGFYRLNNNLKVRCHSPAIFDATEDFVKRYSNVPLAGLNYAMFAKRKDSLPPFVLNTRIYSCILIRNDIRHRWEGRYNEDTHLSLRVLKDGDCTIQINAFLQNKVRTQTIGGGNTADFYANEGTLPKSEMLERLHPDVSRVVWKFDRWHHFVDYNPFKQNRLIKVVDTSGMPKVNEYGMEVVRNELAQQKTDAVCEE